MQKLDFKPKLIGKNSDALEHELSAWENIIRELNYFSDSWKKYFGKEITFEKLQECLTNPNLKYFIQVTYIEYLDNELGRLAKKGQYKMDVLVSGTPFPPFEALIEEIAGIKQSIKRDLPVKFDANIEEVFQNGNFVFPEALKKQIEDKNTFYTKNERENVVLALVQKVCFYINIINNMGGRILNSDLPRDFESIVKNAGTNKKYGELKYRGSGEPRFFIPNLFPDHNMMELKGNALLNMVAHLSDQEIEELTEKIG